MHLDRLILCEEPATPVQKYYKILNMPRARFVLRPGISPHVVKHETVVQKKRGKG